MWNESKFEKGVLKHSILARLILPYERHIKGIQTPTPTKKKKVDNVDTKTSGDSTPAFVKPESPPNSSDESKSDDVLFRANKVW